MSQNPDFEETSLFDLFPEEEKKTDEKEQKNEKTENAAPKYGRGKESAITACLLYTSPSPRDTR